LTRGPIHDGLRCLHNCPVRHNPACCNLTHLKLGTLSDNAMDSLAQGTHYFSNCERLFRGERHGMAKLSQAQVDYIRKNYTATHGQLAGFARRFNVSITSVWRVAHQLSWTG
jgi:hypothetical protein